MDCVSQVQGEGLDSFFDHTTDSTIHGTELALQEIGATQTLFLFRTAVTITQQVSSDQWLEALGPYDQTFYELDEPIEALVMQYVHTHMADFS